MYTVTAKFFDLIYENARREPNNCLTSGDWVSGILYVDIAIIVNKINAVYYPIEGDGFFSFFFLNFIVQFVNFLISVNSDIPDTHTMLGLIFCSRTRLFHYNSKEEDLRLTTFHCSWKTLKYLSSKAQIPLFLFIPTMLLNIQ